MVVKVAVAPYFLFALVADLDLLRDFELAFLAAITRIFGSFYFAIYTLSFWVAS